MGRIRTIKPEFFTSRAIGRLSPRARLAFVWLWTAADDEGRVEWDPCLLRAGAFPFDDLLTEDSMSIQGEITAASLVTVYEVRGQLYAEIRGWSEHQRINRPSAPRCPALDAADRVLTEDSLSAHGGLTPGKEGKGKEGSGSPCSPPPGDVAADKPAKRSARLPDAPQWLDTDAWAGFVEHRRKARKPLTERACKLLWGKLDRWRDAGHDASALLDEATEKGWLNPVDPTDRLRPVASPSRVTVAHTEPVAPRPPIVVAQPKADCAPPPADLWSWDSGGDA